MISGNMVGSYSQIGKTFILQDENGNEITGVVVDNPVVFTAGDSQVADGFIYAGDNGVSTGTREFLAYRTTKGRRAVQAGKSFSIPLSVYDKYNFTEIQCIIAPYNTSLSNSVAAEKVVVDSCVYETGSAVKISDVTSNANTKSIDLNLINDSDKNYIIHYFTYKQEEL